MPKARISAIPNPKSESIRVLLIEDNPGDINLIQGMLAEVKDTHFDLECAERLSAGLEHLHARGIDVVLLDLGLPDSQGLDTFLKVHAQAPEVPIVVLTILGNEDLGLKTVQEGAQDYMFKTQLDRNSLVRSMRYAIERKQMVEALKKYSERLEEMVEDRTQELLDAQDRLVRKEKLATLGQLAGGVGHELRNPLGAIKNAAYFLNMALEEPGPEVKETLEILNKEVETSERIISNLLDFARPKPPIRRKVDINEAVEKALSRNTVSEKIELVKQLDLPPPIILTDQDQLDHVFGNIILNAVQAMPEGGRLVIRTWASPRPEGLVEPSEAPNPEWVAVSFTDTGAGIPEDKLGKVFEPLFTTKAKGIGLGLALTKTVVEGHGGSIEVESKLREGSTFTVRLPVS